MLQKTRINQNHHRRMTIRDVSKEFNIIYGYRGNGVEGIYLLYGEEAFLIEDSIKKIKKDFDKLIDGINYIKVDESNVNGLILNIKTPCFGFDKKLIVVRNSGILKKEGKRKNAYMQKIADEVANYIEQCHEMIKEDNVIVFVEEDVEKNNLYKVIEKYGQIINCSPEKLPNLIKRICAIASAYKVKISEYDAKYLVECCGTNLNDIINEIRKLIEYVGENGTIGKKEIDILTTKQIDSVIFELTDNLGKKDIKKAMAVLNNLIYQKEPVQKILVTLYNHFKKLYITKLAIKTNDDILNSLKLKPNQAFLVNKYKQQSSYFSEKELKNILTDFVDLDYKYKIGLIDINVGIESILCGYCAK